MLWCGERVPVHVHSMGIVNLLRVSHYPCWSHIHIFYYYSATYAGRQFTQHNDSGGNEIFPVWKQ